MSTSICITRITAGQIFFKKLCIFLKNRCILRKYFYKQFSHKSLCKGRNGAAPQSMAGLYSFLGNF